MNIDLLPEEDLLIKHRFGEPAISPSCCSAPAEQQNLWLPE